MSSEPKDRSKELLSKKESNNSLSLTVCLMNGTGLSICVDKKMETLTASEVLDKVCNELSHQSIDSNKCLAFDPKYRNKLFAIWLSSPYLELQLQPTHRPFSVLANWDSLLRKHGPIELIEEPELIDRDEPTICLQRNVFSDKELELGIEPSDIGALRLLYFEAKANVLDGRYPIEDSERLAAIQAAIDLGPYDESRHTVEYFRHHLNDYIACNHMKSNNNSNKINGLIRTLSRGSQTIRCAQRVVKQYEEISKNESTEYKLLRKYMEICWTVDCYGSAYFSAQIERPIKSSFASLMSHFDLKVWLAINREGLHVISKAKPELLLSVSHSDLCWAVGSPQRSDPNCIPCIFIQISADNDNHNNILQIFSRQYRLVEHLLNSFIEDIKQSMNSNNSVSYDCTDGPMTADSVSSSVTTTGFSFGQSKKYNHKKLSIAKFDNSGQCVNQFGSWVRRNKTNSISK